VDLAPGVVTWDRVIADTDHQKNKRGSFRPMLFNLARFAFFSGLLLLAAWIAGTGRVAYILIMLVIAAALAYAVLDLVDYEIVRRKRRG
jgi:Na+/melibiose symporter-like transporter